MGAIASAGFVSDSLSIVCSSGLEFSRAETLTGGTKLEASAGLGCDGAMPFAVSLDFWRPLFSALAKVAMGAVGFTMTEGISFVVAFATGAVGLPAASTFVCGSVRFALACTLGEPG